MDEYKDFRNLLKMLTYTSANASDVTEYMMNETGFWDTYSDYFVPENANANAAV